MKPDVIQPGYDEAGLLRQVDVWLQQAAAPARLLDPATANRHAVTGIDYNARGQRVAVGYGNGTTAAYGYDPQTFRLTSLTTTRPGSFAAAQQTVQALSYFYDPPATSRTIRDDADTQNVIFFRNQRVEPSASYTYDAVYRLIAATGREHLGQVNGTLLPPKQITNDDSFRTGLPQPGDVTAMGTYAENYAYDAGRERAVDGPRRAQATGPAATPTPSRRGSPPPRPATASRPPACPATRPAARSAPRTRTTRTAT